MCSIDIQCCAVLMCVMTGWLAAQAAWKDCEGQRRTDLNR